MSSLPFSHAWKLRFKNKTKFGEACSALWKEKDWVRKARDGQQIIIEANIQQEILKGFRKFYHLEHRKRNKVDEAVGIQWKLDVSKGSGGFLVLPACSGVPFACLDDPQYNCSLQKKKYRLQIQIAQCL